MDWKDNEKNNFNSQESKAIQILDKFVSEVQRLNQTSNPQLVVTQVLSWTKGEAVLTEKVCQLILNSQVLIKNGEENTQVEDLVKTGLIENWEKKGAKEYLESISKFLLNSEPKLLRFYQKILEEEVSADDSQLQEELLQSKLVVKRQGKLEVANRIYKEVFNHSYLQEMLKELRPYGKKLKAWRESGCQDESQLLRREELEKALLWSKEQKLTDEENRFFIQSQIWNLRRD